MNSIQTRKTAIEIFSAPSTFGMPACGHVSDVNVKADMGLAVRTYARGTTAWSPPS